VKALAVEFINIKYDYKYCKAVKLKGIIVSSKSHTVSRKPRDPT